MSDFIQAANPKRIVCVKCNTEMFKNNRKKHLETKKHKQNNESEPIPQLSPSETVEPGHQPLLRPSLMFEPGPQVRFKSQWRSPTVEQQKIEKIFKELTMFCKKSITTLVTKLVAYTNSISPEEKAEEKANDKECLICFEFKNEFITCFQCHKDTCLDCMNTATNISKKFECPYCRYCISLRNIDYFPTLKTVLKKGYLHPNLQDTCGETLLSIELQKTNPDYQKITFFMDMGGVYNQDTEHQGLWRQGASRRRLRI